MVKTTKEIVNDLNYKLWGEKGENNSYCVFIYKDATVWEEISFYDALSGLEMLLWGSENDDREYREETNDYEPLEDYVLREFNKKVKYLISIVDFINDDDKKIAVKNKTIFTISEKIQMILGKSISDGKKIIEIRKII